MDETLAEGEEKDHRTSFTQKRRRRTIDLFFDCVVIRKLCYLICLITRDGVKGPRLEIPELVDEEHGEVALGARTFHNEELKAGKCMTDRPPPFTPM